MSRGTLDPGRLALPFAYRAFTFCGGLFQVLWLGLTNFMPVHNPGRVSPAGLGYIPFRSPLLRESHLISFPPGT